MKHPTIFTFTRPQTDLSLIMASNFHVQKPYVLTTLPRPFDPTTGRYVVGDVSGTADGSRKRKRSEVTVGIDGEAVNIYNVCSLYT